MGRYIWDALYPDTYTMSQYWVLLWGVVPWFVLQRIVTLYMMCRFYKVKPMVKEDIPSFRKAVKHGWRAVFLPIIVFAPFLLTSEFEAFFQSRLGTAGASALNSSLLLFIPGVIVLCGILLSGRETVKKMSLKVMCGQIQEGLLKVVPTAALVLFAYFVGNVFEDLNVEAAIGAYISSLHMNRVTLAFLLPLFTAILGMLLPGSTQVRIFGGVLLLIPFVIALIIGGETGEKNRSIPAKTVLPMGHYPWLCRSRHLPHRYVCEQSPGPVRQECRCRKKADSNIKT